LLVLAAAAGAILLAAPAPAKDPCWKTLIDDWYDGRIDSIYPVACYRAALEHMPEDIAQYSSLGDDINRALQAALAQGSPDPGDPTSGVNGASTPANNTFYGGPTSEPGALVAGRDVGGPLPSVIDAIGPGSADSVPVPLVVLGGLSILLLSLGAAGFATRRVQARRATTRAETQS
jgi:hypothetical protein